MERIQGTWQNANISMKKRAEAATVDSRPSQSNFSTVAIVPVTDDVPLTAFTYEVYHSLSAIGVYIQIFLTY